VRKPAGFQSQSHYPCTARAKQSIQTSTTPRKQSSSQSIVSKVGKKRDGKPAEHRVTRSIPSLEMRNKETDMTMTHSMRALTAVTLIAFSLPMAAAAQSQGGKPPEPNFSGIAKALNVSEAQVKTCMPAPQKGQRPEKPNMKTLTSCFKASNASLTEQLVGDALKEFGPKRPPKK
jgi:hypothetical protein